MIPSNLVVNDQIFFIILLIELHNEPMFFMLELPTNLDDETQVRPGVLETTHKDIL